MTEERCECPLQAVLRQQTWLSPAFPTGAYSYSHGLECAIEAGHIHNRETLVDWLEADLCYGSGRNESIFFHQSWLAASEDDRSRLLRVAELAAVFRSTSEFALESVQQGTAYLATLRRVWRDHSLDWLSDMLHKLNLPPAVAVVLGICAATHGIPVCLALPAFLQSIVANLVNAGVRLLPLGQTDGQLALAQLENVVLAASGEATQATLDDLGSAAFMVDLSSMAHETQYTRLFRS
ncbi:MAG TPA: urease accessory protein UreF [Blastocatellia bacterium]|nr:urease accessory protein UreF [Blastocatellia bacterium]